MESKMKGNKPTGREPPSEPKRRKILLEINCFNFDKTEHF
jgi:hypothetical protein